MSANMESGYEPETGICWYFNNKGDRALHRDCRCPAHTASRLRGEDYRVQFEAALFGRCSSGNRWFWSALKLCEEAVHGWADTEEQAIAAAMNAVRNLKTKPFMIAVSSHQQTRHTLKEVNEAKRRARPAPDTSDAKVTEYLYATGGYEFRITKKTKKRIFYCRQPSDMDYYSHLEKEIGFVDRAKLERDGEIYNHGRHWSAYDFHLYLAPPPSREHAPLPNLPELKAAMAAAHPDRGGSSEAFIEARVRYERARHDARGQ